MMATASRAASSIAAGSGGNQSRVRRLIVDTDLGLDDLVALAILRTQQCLQLQLQEQQQQESGNKYQYTQFKLSGVTITAGVSCANVENAALLRRLLPPDTPVYVSGSGNDADTSLKWMNEAKPTWWTRTAQRVAQFLSSLPLLPNHQQSVETATVHTNENDISAEEFIAKNMDDPNVDFLCMAPLTTMASALHIRSKEQQQQQQQHSKNENNNNHSQQPKATFYIMGGIRSDSKMTKRGESTAPFGYHDVVGVGEADNNDNEASETTTSTTPIIDKHDQFGEFNFALDIAAARTVLSTVSSPHIIPLEACTLVPKPLRPATAATVTLSSILSTQDDGHDQSLRDDDATKYNTTDSAKELYTARSILFKLLQEYGTTETQWDSISAAIYCNAFGTSCATDSESTTTLAHERIDSSKLSLSELGALSFPGCQSNNNEVQVVEDDDHVCASSESSSDGDDDHNNNNNSPPSNGRIYPDFSVGDEATFFRYLSFLLYSDENNSQ